MDKEKRIQECEKKQLIYELSKMSPMVITTAYLHAINYTLYGVDVTEKWVTATQNASALEKAHRKGYYDALQKDAKLKLIEANVNGYAEGLKDSNTVQEPCEDAISRNAVIRTLNEMDRYTANELTLCDTDKKFPANEVFVVDDVYEYIAEQLPSVKPQLCEDTISRQAAGKWHIAHGMYEDRFWCSCGYIRIMDSRMNEWKFCPVCGGARMVEKQAESEEKDG